MGISKQRQPGCGSMVSSGSTYIVLRGEYGSHSVYKMPQALTGIVFGCFVWVAACTTERLSKGLVSTRHFPGKIQMLMREGIYRSGAKKLSCACSILREDDSLKSLLEVTFFSRQTLFVLLCCPSPASQHINVIVGVKAG